MKRFFLCICSIAVLVTGCNDSFVAAPNPVPKAAASRIWFTAIDPYNIPFPFSSIVFADHKGEQRRIIIPNASYLPCAPQGGKVVYIEFPPTGDNAILKVADMNNLDNVLVVETFDNNSIAQLKEITLSPDGRFVAYAILRTSQSPTPLNVIRYFDIQNKRRVDIDSFPAWFIGLGGGFTAFVSQVSFSSDGQYLAVATWGQVGQLRVYEWKNKNQLKTTKMGVGPYFAWVPKNNTLVYTENHPSIGDFSQCMNDFSTLYAYSMPDSSSIATMDVLGIEGVSTRLEAPIMEIACSPNGQQLLYTQLQKGDDGGGGHDDCYTSTVVVRDMNDKNGRTRRIVGKNKGGQSKERRMYGNPQWRPDGSAVSFTEYPLSGFSSPAFRSSSIKLVTPDSSKADIEIFNAFNGYWLP